MTEVVQWKRLNMVDVPITIATRLHVVPSTKNSAEDEQEAVVCEIPVKSPYHCSHERQSD
jgi:hypothetical protein